ncbi:hypothetical protein BLA6863_05076 [Burkholderia lata]|uniref:Uncharacterized protein n=1 Tax=Burkholderia lata (strain ATCC 17760 / DSM 23089 / LMG 22485 / NCIMB 9086 / R18194 / 383) TaxID=482957 RepID=A0A6P2PG16_BURL3|nr:hypothetical protein BLA6863_05076 [Burkholderia lata]
MAYRFVLLAGPVAAALSGVIDTGPQRAAYAPPAHCPPAMLK